MSNYKDQIKVYRVINGIKWHNYCDLIYTEKENLEIINEAKQKFGKENIKLLKYNYKGSMFYRLLVKQI